MGCRQRASSTAFVMLWPAGAMPYQPALPTRAANTSGSHRARSVPRRLRAMPAPESARVSRGRFLLVACPRAGPTSPRCYEASCAA